MGYPSHCSRLVTRRPTQGYETIQTLGRVAATFATSLDTAIEQLVETLTVSDTAGTQPRTPGSAAKCVSFTMHSCCMHSLVPTCPSYFPGYHRHHFPGYHHCEPSAVPMQPPLPQPPTTAPPPPHPLKTPATPPQGRHQVQPRMPGLPRGGIRQAPHLHSQHPHQVRRMHALHGDIS